MIEYITNSYEETLERAAELAKRLPIGSTIGFLGGLGAGKTAFAAGFVKGLGIDSHVSSPTFSICNVYRGENVMVLHYDMYRIESWEDLYTTGYMDYIEGDSYTLVEWSENIYNALPDDVVLINIEKTGETSRKITIMNKKEAETEIGIIG